MILLTAYLLHNVIELLLVVLLAKQIRSIKQIIKIERSKLVQHGNQ